MGKKQRTISYLRACWPEQIRARATLQEALVACLKALPDAADTRLDLREGHAEVRHRRLQPTRLSLHIAAWADQERMSTVPHGGGADADLSSQPPGRDWDYLDGDGMALISQNHCLLMPSGLRLKLMEGYIWSLLRHGRARNAPIPKEMDHFQLIPTANREVVQRAYKQGVKKISLNVGQYMETAREWEESQRKIILEHLGINILKALFTKEEDRLRIERAANVSAQLVIKLDTRRRGLSPEGLVPLAREIAEESEDDVVIETGKGQRIQRGDLVMTKKVNVKAFAKTVDHIDAWHIMMEYFQDLKDSGVLEE